MSTTTKLERLYKYSLDFENHTPNGVHEHGYGTEEQIDTIVDGFLPHAYCEINGDGWLIYQDETEAEGSRRDKVLGRIEFWKEVEIEVPDNNEIFDDAEV